MKWFQILFLVFVSKVMAIEIEKRKRAYKNKKTKIGIMT